MTHLVEVGRATFISSFENGWQVQMVGLLRAAFVPFAKFTPPGPNGEAGKAETQLRLESFDYTVHAHTSYIPRLAIQREKVEHPIPQNVVASIGAAVLAAAGVPDSKGAMNGSGSSVASTSSPKGTPSTATTPVLGGAAGKKREGKKAQAAREKKEREQREQREQRDRENGSSQGQAQGQEERDRDRGRDSNAENKAGMGMEAGEGGSKEGVKEEASSEGAGGGGGRRGSAADASAAATGGGGGGVSGTQGQDEKRYTVSVDKMFLPDSPVNDYGITLRSMRCLEVSFHCSFLFARLFLAPTLNEFNHVRTFVSPADHGKRVAVARLDRF